MANWQNSSQHEREGASTKIRYSLSTRRPMFLRHADRSGNVWVLILVFDRDQFVKTEDSTSFIQPVQYCDTQ
jgi:hypothetical protein